MPDELTLELPRLQTAASLARSAVSDRCADELGRGCMGELLLVVTELVTNAVVHGRGAITLRIRVDGDRVYGEVVDEGGGFEWEVRERGPDEVNGRGLMIVDALSRCWGICEGTTHVWFELARPGDPPRRTGPVLGQDERPRRLDETWTHSLSSVVVTLRPDAEQC
jgi:anti-sigma regulatory factor (Ser/Thr protein kinase)